MFDSNPVSVDASTDALTLSIRQLAQQGLRPYDIGAALNIEASAVNRLLTGGELFPSHFAPNKSRF